jgi:hypothetical protein
MRTPLLLAVALAVLVAGCNRKTTESKMPEPATGQAVAEPVAPAAQGDARAPDAGVIPEPSKEGLKSLCTDPNPYISNNAKHALSSWEAKDYTAAAIGMRKIISLCRSTAQQNAALSSLAQLKLEIDKAAAKGNANAKAAAAQLARAGSP